MDETTAIRRCLRDLLDQALAAAEPGALVRASLSAAPVRARRIRLLAIGKGARAMAQAALAELAAQGQQIAEALVITNAGNDTPLPGALVMVAGHPLPDAGGLAAAREAEAMAGRAGADEALVVLISGGGSAMLPAPAPGISLDDKARATRIMLRAGLDITQINALRQQLSRLKGGGLARAAAPAHVVALILSDVIGDDLRVVASGPTLLPVMTRDEVVAMLRAHDLWAAMPEAVRELLCHDQPGLKRHASQAQAVPDRGRGRSPRVVPQARLWRDAQEARPSGATGRSGAACAAGAGEQGAELEATSRDSALIRPESPALPPATENRLIGSNALLLDTLAAQTGAVIWSRALTGDVAQAARCLVGHMRAAPPGEVLALCGGETTVRVRGAGQGGRNQELALRLAAELHGDPLARPWVFLSAGSDGRDGPTEAAGGLVDAGTLARIEAAGGDWRALLADNDSHRALALAGDLVITGPTGTNLADIQLIALG